MVRDRLRERGANTKAPRPFQGINTTSKSLEAFDSAVPDVKQSQRWETFQTMATTICPSRDVDAASTDIRRRHVFKELDHWLDLAWERKRTDKFHVLITTPLREFCDVATSAIDQDTSRAWQFLHQLADNIAQADWSELSPNGFLRFIQETAHFFYMKRMEPLIYVWTRIVRNKRQATHLIALFLDHPSNAPRDLSPKLLHALFTLHEHKKVIYAPMYEQENVIAYGKEIDASLLVRSGEQRAADETLYRYAACGDVSSTPAIRSDLLSDIYFTLGRSRYFQRKYDKASQSFRRARDLDNGERGVAHTISNVNWLAESLVRSSEINEAKEVLDGPVHHVLHNADAFA